jgi:hypothetical protein
MGFCYEIIIFIMGLYNNSGYNTNKTGWWYPYPPEKYESDIVRLDHPNGDLLHPIAPFVLGLFC